ncbi:MAG: hypothetical protein U9R58_03375 [Chloroflexota bacterium]|nr:hypothetical protein [Chloroflexota bacterium]
MVVIVCHADRVGIEVETRPVVLLAVWRVVSDIDGIVVVNLRLHAIGTNYCRTCGDAQVTNVLIVWIIVKALYMI